MSLIQGGFLSASAYSWPWHPVRDGQARQHTWQRMVRTPMERDFSWDTAARHYLKLYDELTPGFEAGDPPGALA